MEPTVGRIVHYVSRGSLDGVYPSTCRAAVVTALGREHGQVALGVINPTGFFFKESVAYDPGVEVDGPSVGEEFACPGASYAPGSWHWPAGEPAAAEPAVECGCTWSADPESRCRKCPLDRAA